MPNVRNGAEHIGRKYLTCIYKCKPNISDARMWSPLNGKEEAKVRSCLQEATRVPRIILAVSDLKIIAPSCTLLRSLLPTTPVWQTSILQNEVDKLNVDLGKVRARIASQPSRAFCLR